MEDNKERNTTGGSVQGQRTGQRERERRRGETTRPNRWREAMQPAEKDQPGAKEPGRIIVTDERNTRRVNG